MQETKGHCVHGEFDLRTGCPLCIAEREEREGNTEASIAEAVKAVNSPGPEKVQVKIKVTAPEGSPPGEEEKAAGEIVNLAETIAEIQGEPKPEVIRPEQEEMEEGLNAEGLTLANVGEPITITGSLLEETAPETAVVLRPGEDIEVRGYYADGVRLLDFAHCRVITTVEDVKLATDDLSLIAKLKKAMEAKKREYLDPLKSQAEAIRETYSSLMDPIISADKITRGKILTYQQEQERIRQEQEEINRKRMEAAEAEMRLKGELTESVNLVEVTPEAPKRVSTDMGTAGQRDNWKWEVTDFVLLSDEYKVVDSSMLTAVAKKHHDQKQIPGVRFYNEPIITVRAR